MTACRFAVHLGLTEPVAMPWRLGARKETLQRTNKRQFVSPTQDAGISMICTPKGVQPASCLHNRVDS